MAKLTRALQKIFGGSLLPTGNIAQIGSLAAATPNYSTDPNVLQALSQYLGGWAACTTGNSSPALEDMNGLFYLITRQLAYLMQAGIAEYDGTTVYYIGSWVTVAGVAYVSTTDNNSGNPVTDTNHWQTLQSQILGGVPSIPQAALARAWVTFDGTQTGTITPKASYNISSVVRSPGEVAHYTVNFAGQFPNANYADMVTCGWNAATFADFPRVSFKDKTQLQLYSMAQNSAQGASPDINVVIFSNSPLA